MRRGSPADFLPPRTSLLVGKLGEQLRLHVDAVGDWVVVDHDVEAGRLGDRAEVGGRPRAASRYSASPAAPSARRAELLARAASFTRRRGSNSSAMVRTTGAWPVAPFLAVLAMAIFSSADSVEASPSEPQQMIPSTRASSWKATSASNAARSTLPSPLNFVVIAGNTPCQSLRCMPRPYSGLTSPLEGEVGFPRFASANRSWRSGWRVRGGRRPHPLQLRQRFRGPRNRASLSPPQGGR